jgi:hypothetical protein
LSPCLKNRVYFILNILLGLFGREILHVCIVIDAVAP